MSIKYAILGFLSWDSFTGYDLKKMFAESETFHWSGNNNQIYRSLVDLHKQGLVTKEVEHQESLPSRKVYTITSEGRDTLREWLLTPPELPQYKNGFHIQLSWADQLTADELDHLLAQYEEEIQAKLLMLKEQKARALYMPNRTPREQYLWEMIADNGIAEYEQELNWTRELRQGVQEF